MMDKAPCQKERHRRGERGTHPGSDAAVPHARHIRHLLVQLLAAGGGQILHSVHKIGIWIPKTMQRGIVAFGNKRADRRRTLAEQPVNKGAAAVRRVDRCEGSHKRSQPQPGNRPAAVQPALGVSDQVYLFTARLAHNLLHARFQLLRAGGHRSRRLLIPVPDARAVADQLRRDTSPIIKKALVPEKHAVHQHQRIARRAQGILTAHRVELLFLRFKEIFLPHRMARPPEQEQVEQGDPPAQKQQRTPPDSELHGGDEHPGHPVHAEDQADQNGIHDTDQKLRQRDPQTAHVQHPVQIQAEIDRAGHGVDLRENFAPQHHAKPREAIFLPQRQDVDRYKAQPQGKRQSRPHERAEPQKRAAHRQVRENHRHNRSGYLFRPVHPIPSFFTVRPSFSPAEEVRFPDGAAGHRTSQSAGPPHRPRRSPPRKTRRPARQRREETVRFPPA